MQPFLTRSLLVQSSSWPQDGARGSTLELNSGPQKEAQAFGTQLIMVLPFNSKGFLEGSEVSGPGRKPQATLGWKQPSCLLRFSLTFLSVGLYHFTLEREVPSFQHLLTCGTDSGVCSTILGAFTV